MAILNHSGSVWTTVAGGGEPVVYADTISDFGFGKVGIIYYNGSILAYAQKITRAAPTPRKVYGMNMCIPSRWRIRVQKHLLV